MPATKQDDLPPSPYLKANLISKLFFWWLNDFFGQGNKRSLELKDIYQALPNDRSKNLGDRMQQLWDDEVKNCDNFVGRGKKKPSLRRVIIKQFIKEFMLVGLLAFIEECFTKIAQPIALGYLIQYFSTLNTFTKTEGWLLAFAVALLSGCYVFTHHPYFFGVQHVGMRIRIAACSLIYRKSLRLSQAALGATTIGQMVNLLSNDVSRFDQSTIFLHYLWIGPIQTIIVTVILWRYYNVACLAGLSVLVFFVPFQGFMGKQFSKMRTSTAAKTDKRIKIMNEIVGGMRVIKMFAWEKPFSLLVGEAREEEIKVIKKTNSLRAVNMSLFYTSSKIIIFLTLLTYVLMGGSLTAEKVFVTLALYNNVRLIMTLFFPLGVAQLAETLVSIKRIEEFLLMEERKAAAAGSSQSTSGTPTPIGTVKLEQLFSHWTSEQDTLNNINLKVGNQELCVIVGHVGSGKSSLLQVILGELPPTSGKISVFGTLAYTCQEPWIFTGSVRQNILFGRKYDDDRYNRVIEACALKRDLELLTHGDNTIVGEKGSSLSGGQKARINLARAVYSDADIYLLDDPLSAVDAEVGRHIFEQCICGILKDKTRILVTHQLQLLQSVKHIILLEDGCIKGRGDFDTISRLDASESVLKSPPLAARVRNRAGSENSSSSLPFVGVITTTPGSLGFGNEMSVGSTYSINVDDFNEDFEDSANDYFNLTASSSAGDGGEEDKILSHTNKSDYYNNKSKNGTTASEALLIIKRNSKSIPKTVDETAATGGVGLGLYLQYFKAGSNACTALVLILSNLVTQVLYAGSDWWLSFWTRTEEKNDRQQKLPKSTKSEHVLDDRNTHIYIYSGLIGGLFIASMIRTMIFFRICMSASVNLHQSMFMGVLRAPMRFFETNPIGRILNRITKDIGCIDDLLPPTMFDTMEIFLNVIGILILVAIVNPYLLVPALALSFIFYFLRRFYLRTARSVKRIEGIARSPVFSHLSTSLYGLTTIRAFQVESSFIQQFDDFQDMHTSSWFIFLAVSRWFGIWIDWISVTFITFVTFSFMFFATNGANVGLAVSSAMMLTGMTQWGVRQSAEVESQMVSVERVIEYTHLEPEASLETPPGKGKTPPGWPSRGEIKMEHVMLKYGNDDPVLKDISFIIKPSEKIGIVGRTGAGKSSLITALFRIAEPSSGSIVIDDVDVLKLGLHDLRKSISIIPQDPVLFSGTLRYNLDPFDQFKDKDMWQVLEQVHLAHDVKQLSSGLDIQISEGGSNFSVGQRQLCCLGRSILQNNKIIVLDEASSNVDTNTDTLIQKTIKTKFVNCTVLIIAHRLHTVMDCDRILVLDAGSILEFDEPYTLLQNKQGALYGLAEQSGALDALINIAKEAALNRRLTKVDSAAG